MWFLWMPIKNWWFLFRRHTFYKGPVLDFENRQRTSRMVSRIAYTQTPPHSRRWTIHRIETPPFWRSHQTANSCFTCCFWLFFRRLIAALCNRFSIPIDGLCACVSVFVYLLFLHWLQWRQVFWGSAISIQLQWGADMVMVWLQKQQHWCNTVTNSKHLKEKTICNIRMFTINGFRSCCFVKFSWNPEIAITTAHNFFLI